MQAVEFNAHIEGNLIEVPQKYSAMNSKNVRVIVLLDESSPSVTDEQLAFKQSRFAKEVLLNPIEEESDRVL